MTKKKERWQDTKKEEQGEEKGRDVPPKMLKDKQN